MIFQPFVVRSLSRSISSHKMLRGMEPSCIQMLKIGKSHLECIGWGEKDAATHDQPCSSNVKYEWRQVNLARESWKLRLGQFLNKTFGPKSMQQQQHKWVCIPHLAVALSSHGRLNVAMVAESVESIHKMVMVEHV